MARSAHLLAGAQGAGIIINNNVVVGVNIIILSANIVKDPRVKTEQEQSLLVVSEDIIIIYQSKAKQTKNRTNSSTPTRIVVRQAASLSLCLECQTHVMVMISSLMMAAAAAAALLIFPSLWLLDCRGTI